MTTATAAAAQTTTQGASTTTATTTAAAATTTTENSAQGPSTTTLATVASVTTTSNSAQGPTTTTLQSATTAVVSPYSYVLTASGVSTGGPSSLRFSTGQTASSWLYNATGTIAQLSSVLASLQTQCNANVLCLGIFLSQGSTTVTGHGLSSLGAVISTNVTSWSYTKVRRIQYIYFWFKYRFFLNA